MLAAIIPVWLEGLASWWVTGVIGICLYWIPLIVCLIVYIIRGVKVYFDLRKERTEGDYHISSWFDPDKLTIGHVIFFLFVSICPFINLIALKEPAYDIVSYIFKKISRFLSQPLVPDSKYYQDIRENKVDKK